ncbi:glutathione s-transferase-related protein-like protein [Rhizodiscina lignyota]|uniref:Glutathione s-transferase-related protein-like protein n=1 Tax=Rhizodiscina lignyota TaxID=1504668 RepID=A0A9P4IVK2_9PEZI|nr:glutathione s-transferase-related protein-like protein [Rhizodiscina lignyota]
MSPFQTPSLLLFTYPESVVGRRLDWYLTLRRIPYVHCEVDNKMPRPVLERLGVHYRRIPVLAVGRDLYCDSRCIIQTMEDLYPKTQRLGADPKQRPFDAGIQKLLENWAFEGGVFMKTAMLISPDAKLVQDPSWLEDRYQLSGFRFSKEAMEQIRPDALAAARMHLDIVENMLLGDGREWISGGEEPGLADVHVGWPFDWMLRDPEKMGMKHAYPELLNEQKYPKMFAWIDRLNRFMEEKRKEQGELKMLSSDEAVKLIENSSLFEHEELDIVEWDPTGLKKGAEVDLFATDVPNGFQNRDTGELIGLTAGRVTVKAKTKDGIDVRIHYPRINIKIAPSTTGL